MEALIKSLSKSNMWFEKTQRPIKGAKNFPTIERKFKLRPRFQRQRPTKSGLL